MIFLYARWFLEAPTNSFACATTVSSPPHPKAQISRALLALWSTIAYRCTTKSITVIHLYPPGWLKTVVLGFSPNVSLVVKARRYEAPVLRAVAQGVHTLQRGVGRGEFGTRSTSMESNGCKHILLFYSFALEIRVVIGDEDMTRHSETAVQGVTRTDDVATSNPPSRPSYMLT